MRFMEFLRGANIAAVIRTTQPSHILTTARELAGHKFKCFGPQAVQ